MRPATLAAITAGALPKGDVLAVARLAGIMAAKRTADLIPLCHPLPLSGVEVTLEPDGEGTLVRLRHLDLPEETRQNHGEGWDLYLGRLAIAAAGVLFLGRLPNVVLEFARDATQLLH